MVGCLLGGPAFRGLGSSSVYLSGNWLRSQAEAMDDLSRADMLSRCEYHASGSTSSMSQGKGPNPWSPSTSTAGGHCKACSVYTTVWT